MKRKADSKAITRSVSKRFIEHAKSCAIYARVSTVGKSQSTDMQLSELQAYADRRGWKVAKVYQDTMSGSSKQRPGLDALLAAAKRKEFDAIIVYRFDRFARSVSMLAAALLEFQALGIDFISLHEGVDTSTPNGRLVFHIFAAIAEFERELIRDRVRSGIAEARRKGVRLGAPAIHTAKADEVIRRRAAGESFRAIAKALEMSVGRAVQLSSLGIGKHDKEWVIPTIEE